jgi:DNA-binding NarL/FixJ family response regulator
MGRTAVVVDDSAGFRAAARSLLDDAGFTVLGEAADGASALALVRAVAPQVVLLDVQLPDVSGIEVARQLQEDPDPPAVILVSSRDAGDYGPGLTRSGAEGFISKAELSVHAVHALLDRADP